MPWSAPGILLACTALALSACAGTTPTASSRTTTPRHHTSHRHSTTSVGSAPTTRTVQPPSRLLGPRSRTRGCRAHGTLPDPSCTPGAVFVGVTARQVCVLGYSRRVRSVSSSTKRRAYEEYGIPYHVPGQYEVDHLVSLELGGSNSIANLWPEPASPKPGFHEKDQVENYLHQQLCDGRLSLSTVQREIATNWLSVYKKMGR